MSDRDPGFEVVQERDRVPVRKLVLIAIALNVIGASLVTWAWLTIDSRENKLRPARDFSERHLGPRRVVEGVDQALYGEEGSGQALAATKRAGLEGYRWVDPQKRTVQIPITEAMAIVVQRAPAPAPADKDKP